MTRKALGRGLDVILPQSEPSLDTATREVPINLIDPNPNQPRQAMDTQALRDLAQSISEKGIIQPIIVKQVGIRYQLIAGERRLRAAEMAGLNTVPVIIKEVADEDLLILALIENIQREDLNPLEEAQAFESLIKQYNLTQDQLATSVGKERSTIANALRLLKLPQYAINALSDSRLTSGHARALLMLENDPSEMKALFEKIISKSLSVRQAEAMARQIKEKPAVERKIQRITDQDVDPFIREAENRLISRMGTKITIQRGRSGSGVITLHFGSEEELQRIFELLISIKT